MEKLLTSMGFFPKVDVIQANAHYILTYFPPEQKDLYNKSLNKDKQLIVQ